MMECFGFVYLWYDKRRDKLCIGSHFGKLDDKYTTSTGHCKHAIRKRPTDFIKIILYEHYENNRKTLFEKEQLFLNCIPNDLLGSYFYNLKKTANGGSAYGRKLSEETKQKISIKQKGKPRNQIFNITGLIEAKKRKKTCEHCKGVFDLGNYGKYHGEKCNLNPDVDPKIFEERSKHAKKAAKASVLKRENVKR